MNHSVISHRIRCISIIGGFLDGTKFELADGLNCFIGARGAGKTTMLEFVRHWLDAMPSREGQPIASILFSLLFNSSLVRSCLTSFFNNSVPFSVCPDSIANHNINRS
jgi:hypothetical protein